MGGLEGIVPSGPWVDCQAQLKRAGADREKENKAYKEEKAETEQAVAALKRDVAVVRGCVLAVQPVAPAGNGNAGAIARVDAAYVLDTESGTWHTKSACTRVAVGRRALGGASRRAGGRAANLRLGALAAFSERRRGAS